MATQSQCLNRESIIVAVILDALLIIFCIFLIVDVMKQYYLQYPALKYATLAVGIVAGIVAWMISILVGAGFLGTLTVGFAWHTVACLMMDAVTQTFATIPDPSLFSQTSTTLTKTGSSVEVPVMPPPT